MSVYQSFPTAAAALEAFAAGACRRHVEIDGHVIDLVQAMAEQGRVREEPGPPPAAFIPNVPADWDLCVEANVRAALLGRFDCDLPPPARSEVPVQAARAKPGPLCPCCLRSEAAP